MLLERGSHTLQNDPRPKRIWCSADSRCRQARRSYRRMALTHTNALESRLLASVSTSRCRSFVAASQFISRVAFLDFQKSRKKLVFAWHLLSFADARIGLSRKTELSVARTGLTTARLFLLPVRYAKRLLRAALARQKHAYERSPDVRWCS